MTNETNYPNKLSTNDKLALIGHILIATGGLLISISQIIAIAKSGRITDLGPQNLNTINDGFRSRSDAYSANDYFRRG